MPILSIEIVGKRGDYPAGMASRLADAAGAFYRSEAGHTWVRLRWLDPEDYAENEGGPYADVRPVFVSVIEAHPPEDAERARQAVALATVVGEACGQTAEHVHVIYEPPGAGRVAFGGHLVE